MSNFCTFAAPALDNDVAVSYLDFETSGLDVPRNLQKSPEASRSLQEPPGAPRSLQELPEVCRSLQEARSFHRTLQKSPEASGSFQWELP